MSGLGIPWLALGGGGYDLSAVARSWALAYGVMLDVEWPDQLPDSFVRVHGTAMLRDTVVPEVPSDIRRDAQAFAEETVTSVKEQLFPHYSLDS